MINPKIRLHPWLLKQAETFGPVRPVADPKDDEGESVFLVTLTISNLAKVPDFIRYPESHLFDMQLMYEQKRIDVKRMQRRLAKSVLPPAHEIGKFSPPVSAKSLNYLYYAAYHLLLGLALILNGLLRGLNPSDSLLAEESITFSEEVIDLAERMSQYRPLGAGYVPVCLAAAWAATADLSQHGRIEDLISDYQKDFSSTCWMEGAIWLKNRFTILRLKTLALQTTEQDHVTCRTVAAGDRTSRTMADLSRSCCIQ